MTVTVAQFREWLSQFPDDAEFQVAHVDIDRVVSKTMDEIVNHFSDGHYHPPREGWTYRPNAEAMSRGQIERHFPRFAGCIEIGDWN